MSNTTNSFPQFHRWLTEKIWYWDLNPLGSLGLSSFLHIFTIEIAITWGFQTPQNIPATHGDPISSTCSSSSEISSQRASPRLTTPSSISLIFFRVKAAARYRMVTSSRAPGRRKATEKHQLIDSKKKVSTRQVLAWNN